METLPAICHILHDPDTGRAMYFSASEWNPENMSVFLARGISCKTDSDSITFHFENANSSYGYESLTIPPDKSVEVPIENARTIWYMMCSPKKSKDGTIESGWRVYRA